MQNPSVLHPKKVKMKEREIKRKARLDAWVTAMSPAERAFYNSIPKAEELWLDLKPPWDPSDLSAWGADLKSWEAEPGPDKPKSQIKGTK